MNCPADAVVAAGTVCRAAVAGGCDVAETCTGTNSCPADAVRPAGTVCRASVNQPYCDPAEVCTGSSNACPADTVTRTPTTETCNSVDDNCNGTVDEGSSTACASAINTMSFVPGSTATYTGYVPSTVGAEQWYVATFVQNADYNSHGTGTPTVNLTPGTGDASLRMEIRYGSCAAAATCTPGTSWTFTDNASAGGGSPTGAYSTRNVAWPTTVYIRLYRTTAGSAVCSNYSLTISR
ncbi:MAG: hypothetical protein U0325_27250 [Polyangiales bacterium]